SWSHPYPAAGAASSAGFWAGGVAAGAGLSGWVGFSGIFCGGSGEPAGRSADACFGERREAWRGTSPPTAGGAENGPPEELTGALASGTAVFCWILPRALVLAKRSTGK